MMQVFDKFSLQIALRTHLLPEGFKFRFFKFVGG